MRRTIQTTFVLAIAAVVLTAVTASAWAQSGSRVPYKPTPKVDTGAEKTPQEISLALKGYCPVCIIELRKWVKGKPEHQVVFDGRRYHFPGQKQKEMFLANSNRYAPVLGGDCVISLAKMGKRVPGKIRHTAYHDNRLFLFANEKAKEMFVADPAKYADVDLAHGGNCAVSLIEKKVNTLGKADWTLIHGGLRYQFVSEENRDLFLTDPDKYIVRK